MNLFSMIKKHLQNSHQAKRIINQLDNQTRTLLIKNIAHNINLTKADLLEANQKDVTAFEGTEALRDRLTLTDIRLEGMIAEAYKVATLPDPTGTLLLDRTLNNGLLLKKVTVPLGTIGMIYESRPNVTLDAACLGLRSGNVMLLKGSKDALESNKAIVEVIQRTLADMGLPMEAVQLLPAEREAVGELLQAEKYVDLLIPRGGAGLIRYVRENAMVPVIETGAGVCHTYVHESADLEKAVNIVENAKTARPSVCNAMDTLLIDEPVVESFLPAIAKRLSDHRVEIFADETSFEVLKKTSYPLLQRAKTENFGREYQSLKCSVKVVKTLEEALEHIEQYSSKHSEAIIAEDEDACERFRKQVDAACVYSNASTYFSDGGCFELGAEIGISTQKLHARGPFALEKLVCEKWVIEGSGQIRSAD